jgi:hypothetical protein
MVPKAKVTPFWIANSCRITDGRPRLYPNVFHREKSAVKNQCSFMSYLSGQDTAYAPDHIPMTIGTKFPDN